MATNYSLRVNAPIRSETGSVAVATAATTAGSISFGNAVRVWIQSDTDTLITLGTATGATAPAAPTTGDLRLVADADYVLDLRPNITTNARVKLDTGASAGRLRWAKVA
jgi:hypothetical protein